MQRTESQTIETIPNDLKQEVPSVLSWARELHVTTPAGYTEAVERLKSIKTISKRISEWFTPMKRKMDEAKKAILDAEKTLSIPLAQAEELAKSELQRFDDEQTLIAEKERAARQAKLDEDTRREKERLEKQAAKLKSPEKAEALREQAANVVAPIVPAVSARPDVPGASFRVTWKHEMIDLAEFYKNACDHQRWDLLLPNDKTIAAYARAMREQARMPGVRFYEHKGMAISGGR